MKKMTLTANTAHELSRIAEKRSHEEAYAEAEHLIEGHISRTIKAACDKGAFGVDFKFPKNDKLVWNHVQTILCDNGYKVSIKQSEPVLVVRW